MPSYRAQIRDALTKNLVRVIDLFREWDDDQTGTVDKKEFRKAMPMLGLKVSKAAIDHLFDSWDPDKSGVLTIDELQKLLRRGTTVELDAALQPGAAGEIELQVDQNIALRKGGVDKGGANIMQALTRHDVTLTHRV